MTNTGRKPRHQLEFFEDGYVIHTMRGPVTVEALADALALQVNDPRWRPGMSAVLDVRELDLAALAYDDMLRFAEETRAMAGRLGQGRVAILVARPVDFGRGRQYSALTETEGGRERRVFTDLDAALAWVRGESDAL